MSQVKTHWLGKKFAQDKESQNATCEFCQRKAAYWTQKEGEDWKPLSRVIYHCQKHRANAREKANESQP